MRGRELLDCRCQSATSGLLLVDALPLSGMSFVFNNTGKCDTSALAVLELQAKDISSKHNATKTQRKSWTTQLFNGREVAVGRGCRRQVRNLTFAAW